MLAGLVDGLTPDAASAIVAGLLGSADDHGPAIEPNGAADPETRAFLREVGAIAALRGDLPVYPPIASLPSPDTLRAMCRGIVAAGLNGVLIAGLEQFDAERRHIVRTELADRWS